VTISVVDQPASSSACSEEVRIARMEHQHVRALEGGAGRGPSTCRSLAPMA
jgi:hypothetical protein